MILLDRLSLRGLFARWEAEQEVVVEVIVLIELGVEAGRERGHEVSHTVEVEAGLLPFIPEIGEGDLVAEVLELLEVDPDLEADHLQLCLDIVIMIGSDEVVVD
jgi:hypothetical protein